MLAVGIHFSHEVGEVETRSDAGEGCGVCGTPHPANCVRRPLPARRGEAYGVAASVHPIALLFALLTVVTVAGMP
jgi:hypothetical protein